VNTLILFPFQLNVSYITHLTQTYDQIILTEFKSMYERYPYHKKRILLHRSAVEHFYHDIKDKYKVIHEYIIDDEAFFNRYNHIDTHMFFPNDVKDQIIVSNMDKITWHEDPLFLSTIAKISLKKPFRMDAFYKEMRLAYNILLDSNKKPLGGKYSHDAQNRKVYKKGLSFHPLPVFQLDEITLNLAKEVDIEFKDHPGSTDNFTYVVSRKEALTLLEDVMDNRLHTFGDYQDVMISKDPIVSHLMISHALNLSLISPKEVLEKALQVFHNGMASLESTEGFIRQVLGWREYIRLVYLNTKDYHSKNFLNHHNQLPEFFWTSKTDLNCLKEVISETIESGYNHHIQRLMVLSNYANLIGVEPEALNHWFNSMYVDSFDWVVTPNVNGMGLYADGGLMSSKPYISSAAYIHKMSNYCDNCKYDPLIKTGERACPFNLLYWDFIDRHECVLKQNPRMSMMTHKLKDIKEETYQKIKHEAKTYIESLHE
jgi:deoxyribodipyrimidine photolyase-related protein